MHSERRAVGVSRRSVIASAAGAGLTGLAGCLGGERSDADVVCSFFTFFDFTRRLAAETPLEVENLVPVGLHGHGWEPDPTVIRDIIEADAFVHVGEDFQPWADRAIRTVRDDGADTHLINSREGIDLIDLAASVDDEEEVGSGKDPHFWLDPRRAKRAVVNLQTGLLDVAPEHEATIDTNATDLLAELDAIDEEWQSVFEAAQREVVFLAAHNAFEYVGERYGATIQPLVTNLAATDDVRPEDRRRAQEVIEDNDIEFIGAAVFEPRRPARQLLRGTDVRAYYPVTPYAGITETWNEQGWGYFDITRRINMPTFKLLLDVESPAESRLDDRWRNFE